MFRVAASRLLRAHKILVESRATAVGWSYPEPITQQTLAEFLKDINYFDEPKNFVNIGVDENQLNYDYIEPNDAQGQSELEPIESKQENVDQVLVMLSQELKVPDLDLDDTRLVGQDILDLAISCGIYRDLFTDYAPDREDVKFTPEQAEKMNKLIPNYWITDQPFARVQRHRPEQPPLPVFVPALGVSARFISPPCDTGASNNEQNGGLSAHTAYHGNIIPACEAQSKPSITLDGKLLHSIKPNEVLGESSFNNWSEGSISFANFPKDSKKHFTIALVNLDYLHPNSANLHWLATNIKPTREEVSKYHEACEYLPVHGIKGFGYSRYVFLVFQHDSPIQVEKIASFAPEDRKFDAKTFLSQHNNANMIPIGLSWFQTTWDISSNQVFHNYLDRKAPVYEHVQKEPKLRPEQMYPGRVPFNKYLDHFRSKKSINEQVLLERLKSIDPFDYKDQYVPPRVPPTIFNDRNQSPSWMHAVNFKKMNKLGYWRGLRPASMTIPLDNNADLDYPIKPLQSSKDRPPNKPNEYPYTYQRPQLLKEMPTAKPVNEFAQVFIQEGHEVHMDKVRKIMEEFKIKRKNASN